MTNNRELPPSTRNGGSGGRDAFDDIPTATLDELYMHWLLKAADGRIQLLAALRSVAAPLGTDPRRLIHYVASAITGCVIKEGDGLGAIMPQAVRLQYEAAVTSLAPTMMKLAEIGHAIDPAALGLEWAASEAHPWLEYTDHVAAAAMPFVGSRDDLALEQAAAHLAAAARLIAGVPKPEPVKRRYGPVGEMGEAYRIVRAVCLYRAEQEQPITCKWGNHRHEDAKKGSERADDEVPPVSETAQLIAAMRTVLRLKVRNASLAKAHEAYIKQLVKEQRVPAHNDLLIVE